MSTEDWGPIVQLREIAIPTDAMRVDRDSGVIHGVRILGPSSLNGRKYTPEAIQKAMNLYENRPVNVDHPGKADSGQRRVSDRFGWIKNIKYNNQGLDGELHYLKSHPQAEAVIEAAERNPALFGLSHNADGRMVRRGKEYLVEEIVGVRSVDLVADPATTKSLFESLDLKELNMEDDKTPAKPESAFEKLVEQIRPIYEGQDEARKKADAITATIRESLQVVEQPVPPVDPPKDNAEMIALKEQIEQLKETATSLTEAAKVPVTRPRSGVAAENLGQYQKPKDTAEVVKRLKSRI